VVVARFFVLGTVLEPVADPSRAAMGIMRLKAGCHITLQSTYCSVSAFSKREILTFREDILVICVEATAEETVHILSWANLGVVSISFE